MMLSSLGKSKKIPQDANVPSSDLNYSNVIYYFAFLVFDKFSYFYFIIDGIIKNLIIIV